MGLDRRGDVARQDEADNRQREDLSRHAKPFDISKREVWEAYKKVKANRGAAGVDRQTIEEFDSRLADNLYKLWNRLASGSYQPPPVRRVEIPKAGGGVRPLGIPTVADRVAQMVVKQRLEPQLEPRFHPDSYGYRPGRSAHQAVAMARVRCWQYDWVLDLDIKGFFDSIDHALLMKAIRHHTKCRVTLLYIERWLRAPVGLADGTTQPRDAGTPQGGVISPLLANLFLHYVFDEWMRRTYPGVPFERYADDVVCHCRTMAEAEALKAALEQRMAQCSLALHPQKTKVVYCRDDNRRERYSVHQFDFLGFCFRPRFARSRAGTVFVSFLPAISRKAAKAIRQTVRRWRLHCRHTVELPDLAQEINPVLKGWLQYYGRFYRSALYAVFDSLDQYLVRWVRRKYKRLKDKVTRARELVVKIRHQRPGLFAHWILAQNGGQ
ncbi:RNA-directed DNA polymerase [Paraburkholderia youngii]|uniref:group II intron reverse transcriptase/maturase n=1 Tax=Paraburkholderia youngii TaxID=2782701 RepID=UPI003D1FECB7